MKRRYNNRPKRNIRDVRKSNEALFASMISDPKARLSVTDNATTAKSSITSYLKQPYSNYNNIASSMRDAYVQNGIVTKVIDHYVSLPTYAHTIYPMLGNKVYQVDSNMQNDFIDVAYELEQLNIPFYAPYFFRETLIQGVSYFYKIEDNDGVGYMTFPISWCKIRSQDNGVYRFMLDMSKIKKDIYDTLPVELQTAYDNYKGTQGTDDTTQWYDGKWYFVGEAGVAFTFDPNALVKGGVAVSPFAGMLIDNVSLQQAKDAIEVKSEVDNLRIIHNKVPTNSDGIPTMNLKTVKAFDDQMRRRLPPGVVSVTSPSKLENISLKGAGNSSLYEDVESAIEQVFYDMGASSPLFGGKTTSANIVKENLKRDASWVYTNFFPLITAYYNFEISQVKTKSKVKWVIKFIKQSNFTRSEDIKDLKEGLTLGGSRLDYLAGTGNTPAEVVSKLAFEQQVLNIDSLMVVKPTSNTISAKEAQSQSEQGRPSVDNPSDDTDRLDNEQ